MSAAASVRSPSGVPACALPTGTVDIGRGLFLLASGTAALGEASSFYAALASGSLLPVAYGTAAVVFGFGAGIALYRPDELVTDHSGV
jgi:hypothetical protein